MTFRTPSLRNLSATGPYLHNSVLGTLFDLAILAVSIDTIVL